MEILLILACAVMLFVVLSKASGLQDQLVHVRRTLERLNDQLDDLTRRAGGLPPSKPVPDQPAPEPAPPPEPAAPDDMPAQFQHRGLALVESLIGRPEPAKPTVPPVTLPGAAEPSKPDPAKVEPQPEPIPSAIQEPMTARAETAAGTEAPATPPPPTEPPPPEPPQAPPPSEGSGMADFEKRFGTQWVVWVGGLALALGGIFLVRYSIEQGLFGPGLRVLFGAILALVLVGLGELARRRELVAGITERPGGAHIPSILTAAGTTVAYADVWAAYALYQFLSPAVAFLLLGLVALATLAAALVHGPALGGLGLIGAYVTPALVSAAEPNYWALYLYLTVVTAAAYALARARLWRWLAITAAVFSILWMFVGMGDPRFGSLPAHAFFAVAGFALAAFFLVAGLFQGPEAERGRADPVSSGVLAGYLLGAFMLVIATAHSPLALATLFVLAAATVAICWRSEAAILAMPAAAILASLVVVHWAVNWWFVTLVRPGGPWSGLPYQMQVVGLELHVAFAAATAVLFGAAGYLVQGRSTQSAFATLWAIVAVALPVVLLIVVYYRIAEFERSIPFAALALLLAALYGVATETLWKRDPQPGSAAAGALFAVGAVASLALALTFALERGWLTVAFSLMVPGVALIADRRPLPMLRKLCGLLVVLVLARITWDPRIVGANVGTTPIFNWLLWGYGVPAVSFWVAAHIMRRRGDDASSRSVDSAAILFTTLLAFLEIRHLMNDGDIYKPIVRLGETGLQVSTALAMAIGLEHMRVRSASVIHDWGARILAALAFLGIFALLLTRNPMNTGEPVGGPFLNYILLGYGIPAVLLGVLARTIRNTRPQSYYICTAILAIVMMLVYLTLEVRTLFHGPVLTARFMTDAEDYTYSAVWLAFGVALLLAGIALKSQPARLASAAVVILTIGKVFLHDLAGVQGIYRAFSFIGLGLVLIGIGWLYQRLLFPPRPASEAVPAPSAPAP